MAFSPFAEISTGSYVYANVAGDFTGDGQIDFIAAVSGGPTLYEGNGDGTFLAPTLIDAEFVASVVGRDLDQDGDLDLVTEKSVFLNRGDGTFALPIAIELPAQIPLGYFEPVAQSPSSVAVGDIDADGKLDLLVTGRTWASVYVGGGYYGPYFNTYTSGHVNVLLGNGDGSVRPAIVSGFAQEAWQESTALAQLSDDNDDGLVDEDDNLDLVVKHFDWTGAAQLLLGRGDGSFAPATQATVQKADRPLLGDFDEDGLLDLLSHNNIGLQLNRGLSDGSFAEGIAIELGGAPSIPRSVAVGDIDGDGNLDIAVSTQRAYIQGQGYYDNPYPYYGPVYGRIHDGVKILLGNGGGGFAAPIAGALGVHEGYSGNYHSSQLVDVDGDGRLDFALLDRYHGRLTVAINDRLWTPPASLSIDDIEIVEGDSGEKLAAFTVTASGHGTTVSVEYATGDVSATSGVDYSPVSGRLTFVPGVFTQTIEVPIIGDREGELLESFKLTLANPSGAILDTSVGVGSIVDNEPTVSIDHAYGIDPLTVIEGDGAAVPAVFTVTLSAAYDREVTVGYETFTAHTADIVGQKDVLRFSPGETTKDITVLVVGDLLDEPLEAFNVILTGSNHARIFSAVGYGIIEDNDPPRPEISIGDTQAFEGNGGTRRMTFTISLSYASDVAVTVNYATADGTAKTSNNDYVSKSSTLTIPAGQASRTLAIDVQGDKSIEADEVFYVNLSNPVNGVIVDGRARGKIKNDDGPKRTPAIRISDAQVVEGDFGSKLMLFTVRLSQASDESVTVRYATRNGTADYRNRDYAPVSGELRFRPGETAKSIVVRIRGDRNVEPDEELFVSLSSVVGADVADRRGRGIILDNDG